MVSYILYRTASALVRVLPRAVAKRIAALIAFLFYVTRPTIRRNVRRNFEMLGIPTQGTFPVFRNFACAVTDFLALSAMKTEQLVDLCSVHGIEHLEGALKRGAGAILFAPHLGPWEVAGARLTALGYLTNTVALEHPSERVTRFFSKKRKVWGFNDYPARASATGLFRALERRELVVLLVDRSFTRRGARLRFLGGDVLLPDGHVVLSMRTGAPLVPCSCFYTAAGKIEVFIGEQLMTPPEGASTADIANECLGRIEELVRAHPEQWFAFDHLWEESSHV